MQCILARTFITGTTYKGTLFKLTKLNVFIAQCELGDFQKYVT